MSKFQSVEEVKIFYDKLVCDTRTVGKCLEYGKSGDYTQTTKRVSPTRVVRQYVHKVALLNKLQCIELKKGQESSHLCHNKACIKADHLNAEPHKVNQNRTGCAKERAVYGIENFCFGHGDGHPNCI